MATVSRLDQVAALPEAHGIFYEQNLDIQIRHSNGRSVTFIWEASPDAKRLRDGWHHMRLVALDGSLHIPSGYLNAGGFEMGHQEIGHLANAISSVATSRYANAPNCDPFTDEAWANVPSDLDPGYMRQLPLF